MTRKLVATKRKQNARVSFWKHLRRTRQLLLYSSVARCTLACRVQFNRVQLRHLFQPICVYFLSSHDDGENAWDCISRMKKKRNLHDHDLNRVSGRGKRSHLGDCLWDSLLSVGTKQKKGKVEDTPMMDRAKGKSVMLEGSGWCRRCENSNRNDQRRITAAEEERMENACCFIQFCTGRVASPVFSWVGLASRTMACLISQQTRHQRWQTLRSCLPTSRPSPLIFSLHRSFLLYRCTPALLPCSTLVIIQTGYCSHSWLPFCLCRSLSLFLSTAPSPSSQNSLFLRM